MIDVPIFELVKASDDARSLLEADSILRVWRFGSAPDEPKPPYVTWQIIGGIANNNLDSRPDSDHPDIQIDVYGTDDDEVGQVAKAVRDAIELECYLTRYGFADRDPLTGMPHYNFDVSWIINR
ncbi:tail completion protein gp17 [Acinetobacter colistiniresistens]|uniref:DUF3168 domain-containing protein n=1 Tax=Acinetobacter colistiniresistens TaxID=280145 RepID=A0A558EZ24_9GAMM|nr:DUF3168 domain-containing protein [Acinetobacter colistiniresistens]TVT78611.1 DUF3168 domain-containing protein [Acinetobacter colistiniresistens]